MIKSDERKESPEEETTTSAERAETKRKEKGNYKV
jgi:hypothetical protein